MTAGATSTDVMAVQAEGQMSADTTQAPRPMSAEASSCLAQLSCAVSAFLEKLERRGHEQEEDVRRPRRPHRARGRVTLRLGVTEELRRYYRWLERLFERRGPRGVPFVRFLCASLLETWKDSLGPGRAYAEVYARDRYRCTSPVCTSRHVTPHHLQFRSAGGDDSNENLTSLCVWCHLEGVHRGRLRAAPPASDVTWTLGQRGHEHTTVRGRLRARGATRAAAT